MHVYAYFIGISWLIEHTQARQNTRLRLRQGAKEVHHRSNQAEESKPDGAA